MTLREIVKKLGKTNKVVSDALGVSETNIRRYDDLNKRSIEEVLIIAKALDISPSELIGFSIPSTCDNIQSTESRLLSIIESQQRTIENLTKK